MQVFNYAFNLGGDFSVKMEGMSEAMGEFNANISATQQGIGKITQTLATFNIATDFFTNISEAFSGITEAGSAAELQLMNLKTLFGGNAEAAEDMFARISKYGKETVYDRSSLNMVVKKHFKRCMFLSQNKLPLHSIFFENNMNLLSQRLNALSPSETLAMSQKSNELKASGIDVINLSVGEPDFDTPDHIKEAAKKAIDENYSRYSPVAGYPALRKAIVEKLKNENGLDFSADEIVCSNGAKQSVCNVIMAIVDKGDEVIIPAPYWVSYPEMVKLAEGVPVIVSAGIEQDFKITPRQLEQAITPRTKAFVLCSPSNPTGAVYSKEELNGLADVLAKHPNITIISDEIYEHINYIGAHASIAAFDSVKQQTVIVNGVSKAYAMTGWRIGFIAAPQWVVKACNKLQGQYTSGPCSVSQKAAEAAYTGTQHPVEVMRKAFEKRRNLIVDLAKEISGFEVNVPQGAFYLFPKCDAYFGKSYNGKIIDSAADLAMFLLEEGHVACVGGGAFGAPDCIRMSYATSDENIVEAMRRIKNTLALLK